jgi:hypothetical protein
MNANQKFALADEAMTGEMCGSEASLFETGWQLSATTPQDLLRTLTITGMMMTSHRSHQSKDT